MRTNSALLHLTLNTGHRAFTSGLTPPDELAAVQSLLQRGGPIPSRPPYHVDLKRQPGAASYCIYRGIIPVTLNFLVWDEAAEAEAWAGLEAVYLELSDQRGGAMAANAYPARPECTPWLATLLLPTLPLLGSSLSDLRWIGTFERIYAEALLAQVAA